MMITEGGKNELTNVLLVNFVKPNADSFTIMLCTFS